MSSLTEFRSFSLYRKETLYTVYSTGSSFLEKCYRYVSAIQMLYKCS